MNMKQNPSKCNLGIAKVVFFLHLVNSQGVKLNVAKMEAIHNFPMPIIMTYSHQHI